MCSRIALSDNKAGMQNLDTEKINQIMYEASKGSKFFENEVKKDEEVNKKIAEQKKRISKITETELTTAEKKADEIIKHLEQGRNLNKTIVHIDMDAFYAAVETRDNPSLKDKPMAVGSSFMLSTSNYIARRFGVRAAMPGFIAKKLCSQLIIIPPNFKKYTMVSQLVHSILVKYDENFCPISLDEAYLDFTKHLETRKDLPKEERTVFCRTCDNFDQSFCLCDPNFFFMPGDELCGEEETLTTDILCNNLAEMEKNGSLELNDLNLNKEKKEERKQKDEENLECKEEKMEERKKKYCPSCKHLLPSYKSRVFGFSADEAVQEMRCQIEQRTQLTASAGIAPNTMLAKICSDQNKPNGQFKLPYSKQAILQFMKDLPIRKVCGIGKVTEKMLQALNIISCSDLYKQRGLLNILYSETSFEYFMQVSLGIGSTQIKRDSNKKSLSTEQTFSEISKPSDLYKKCQELCEVLASDLHNEGLMGRTISIKLKSVDFDVKTRSQSILNPTSDMDIIYQVVCDLIRTEMAASSPKPLRLRLMGVRISNFLPKTQYKKQNTIIDCFIKKDLPLSNPTHRKDLPPSNPTHTKDLPLSNPTHTKDLPLSNPTHTKDLPLSNPTHTKDLPPSNPTHTKDLPLSNPTHTKDLPLSNPTHTKDLPLSNPTHTKDLPLSNPTHTKDLPLSNPTHTKDLPLSNPTHTKDLPLSNPTHTKDLPLSNPTHTKDLPLSNPTHTKDLPLSNPTHTKDLLLSNPTPTKDLPLSNPTHTKDLPLSNPTHTKDLPLSNPTHTKDLPLSNPTHTKDLPLSNPTPTKDLPLSNPTHTKDLPLSNPTPTKDLPLSNPTHEPSDTISLNSSQNFVSSFSQSENQSSNKIQGHFCPICNRKCSSNLQRLNAHIDKCLLFGQNFRSSRNQHKLLNKEFSKNMPISTPSKSSKETSDYPQSPEKIEASNPILFDNNNDCGEDLVATKNLFATSLSGMKLTQNSDIPMSPVISESFVSEEKEIDKKTSTKIHQEISVDRTDSNLPHSMESDPLVIESSSLSQTFTENSLINYKKKNLLNKVLGVKSNKDTTRESSQIIKSLKEQEIIDFKQNPIANISSKPGLSQKVKDTNEGTSKESSQLIQSLKEPECFKQNQKTNNFSVPALSQKDKDPKNCFEIFRKSTQKSVQAAKEDPLVLQKLDLKKNDNRKDSISPLKQKPILMDDQPLIMEEQKNLKSLPQSIHYDTEDEPMKQSLNKNMEFLAQPLDQSDVDSSITSFICPSCNKQMTSNMALFNQHIDLCLNQDIIHHILVDQGEELKKVETIKRKTSPSLKPSKKKKQKIEPNSNKDTKMLTLHSFFS